MEKGSVLLLVMLVLVLLIVFFGSLSLLVIQEIQMTEYSHHRTQAAYNAEAALAEARLEIENKPGITAGELQSVAGSLAGGGEYEIVTADIWSEDGDQIFNLKARGQSGEVVETIRRLYRY